MKPLRPEDGAELHIVATAATVTPVPTVLPLRPQDAALRLLVERLRLVAWTTDRSLRVGWGLKSPSLSGLESRVARLLESTNPQLPALAAHRRALAGESAEFDLAWKGRTLRVRVEPIREGEAIVGTVALALEAESGRGGAAEEAAAETGPADPVTRGGKAARDAVTGLPDRSAFLARLRRCTSPQWCVDGLFVLLLDLHRFRDVNDRLGFEAGDRVLAEVAQRLKRRLRASDTLARFGPDEFAVLLAQVGSGRDATRVAERLAAEVESPLEVDGRRLVVRCDVGIGLGVPGGRSEDVVREAERALARARVLGRGQGGARAAEGEEASLLHVETTLRAALDQDEIRARYRPTLLRKQGKVPSFEVVLWHRPLPAGDHAEDTPARTG